jgi:hypothetical protein
MKTARRGAAKIDGFDESRCDVCNHVSKVQPWDLTRILLFEPLEHGDVGELRPMCLREGITTEQERVELKRLAFELLAYHIQPHFDPAEEGLKPASLQVLVGLRESSLRPDFTRPKSSVSVLKYIVLFHTWRVDFSADSVLKKEAAMSIADRVREVASLLEGWVVLPGLPAGRGGRKPDV